jgi:hypothetical protein
MPRLHVTKITSIGVVAEGDNPDARVLLYKSKPEKRKPPPAIQRAAIEKALADRDEQLTAATERIDAHLAAVNKATGKDTDMAPTRAELGPEGTVRGEVDRLALELVEKGEASSLTQARLMVWKARPDLVDASRADGERVYHRRRAPMPEDSPGVAGEVVKAVGAWALELTGVPANWTKSTAALRAEIWRSPRGRLLRDLYTDANTHGDKVMKADRHAEARKVLRQLQDDPAVFIVG